MIPMSPARVARLYRRGDLADAQVRLQNIGVALRVTALGPAVDSVVGLR